MLKHNRLIHDEPLQFSVIPPGKPRSAYNDCTMVRIMGKKFIRYSTNLCSSIVRTLYDLGSPLYDLLYDHCHWFGHYCALFLSRLRLKTKVVGAVDLQRDSMLRDSTASLMASRPESVVFSMDTSVHPLCAQPTALFSAKLLVNRGVTQSASYKLVELPESEPESELVDVEELEHIPNTRSSSLRHRETSHSGCMSNTTCYLKHLHINMS